MSLISLETKVKFSYEDLKVYRQYLQAEIETVDKLIEQKKPVTKSISTIVFKIKDEEVKRNKLNLIKELRNFFINTIDLSLGLQEAKQIIDRLYLDIKNEYIILVPIWKELNESEVKNNRFNDYFEITKITY